MATKISEATNIDSVRLQEQASAPATPTAGYVQLYALDTPSLGYKDDAGNARVVTNLDETQTLTNKTLTDPVITQPYVTKTNTDSPYTVLSSNYVVLVDASSGAVVITLPIASTVAGQTFQIFAQDKTNSITINTTSSENIQYSGSNATSIVMSTEGDNITFFSIGSGGWIIL